MEIEYKAVMGIALMVAGAGVGLWTLVPAVWKRFMQWGLALPELPPDMQAPVTGSDAPAPSGVTGYLALVSGTAPKAEPAIWWAYACKELTIAQVLTAERDRLGGGP